MSDHSPFDILEESFRLLCAGPAPLSLHGRDIGPPLPSRPIPLTELRGILLHPSTPFGARDRAARLLLLRAQRQGAQWTVGLTGLLLPGLRAAVADVARARPDEAEDLESEVLAEFVAVIVDFDSSGERIASRLLWRAAQRARRKMVRERVSAERASSATSCVEPRQPWGHPDFVLAEAVTSGVLSDFEAAVIGATRLEGVPVSEYAARVGWQPASLRKERSVAERRLARWISKN